MLIGAEPVYSRITESYSRAAAFENQGKPVTAETGSSAMSINDEAPAYILSLSGEAKELAEEQQGDKASDSEDQQSKAAEVQEPWLEGKSEPEQNKIEREIEEYKRTEAEVVQHENAHKGVGGQYAGGISYERTAGPDGKQYIVGGEVSIDTSKEDTPQRTIAKMQVVKRAALAPANPSGQDRSVASTAAAKEAEARKELAAETREKASQAVSGANAAPKDEIKTFKDKQARAQEVNMGQIVDLSA